MAERRFVILDRDGTIIRERHYLSDPEGVELIPGVAEALSELTARGLGLIVVTNQAGVGRGFFDRAALDRVHQRMAWLLSRAGVRFDGIYVCPHAPEDDCPCRKPGLGLMEQARREHGFDPGQSFVIGDKALDIEFGQAAGARTILVRTGYGREVEAGAGASPDHVVDDLASAAAVIRQIISREVDGEPAELRGV